MSKDYIVLSQRLAGWLMLNGYVLKRLKKTNKPDSNRNVFIFNGSDELLDSIKQYKQNN